LAPTAKNDGNEQCKSEIIAIKYTWKSFIS